MIKEVEGIVISEIPYGETSKIINIFTSEYGIIGVICKGAKSMKSRLRALTTKFTYGIFNMYYKEDKLSTLISVDIIDDLKNIKKDITLLGYLTYLIELSTQVYKQSNDSVIYDLLIKTINKIEAGIDPQILTNILELKLLDYLGITLDLDECVVCGNKNNIVTINMNKGGYICGKCHTTEEIVNEKIIKLIRMYYYVDIESISKIDVSFDVSTKINILLDNYYDAYTGLYLNSKKFLNSLRK